MLRSSERRRAVRRTPHGGEPLSRVRLRTGRDLTVCDLSERGLLVTGGVRLLPGTHVDVHVVTRDGRVLIRSRVVRCQVTSLVPQGVIYTAALMFDGAVDTAPADGYSMPEASGTTMPATGHDYPADAHSGRR